MWRWFENWQWSRDVRRAERIVAKQPVPEALIRDVLVMPSGRRLEVRCADGGFRPQDGLEGLWELPSATDCPEEER